MLVLRVLTQRQSDFKALPTGRPEEWTVLPIRRVIAPGKPVDGHLPPRISRVWTPSRPTSTG